MSKNEIRSQILNILNRSYPEGVSFTSIWKTIKMDEAKLSQELKELQKEFLVFRDRKKHYRINLSETIFGILVQMKEEAESLVPTCITTGDDFVATKKAEGEIEIINRILAYL